MISVHFYKADSFLGRLVNLFGQTEYVHCAVQIDSKHVIETDFGGKVSMIHTKMCPTTTLYFDMNEQEEKYILTKFNNLVGAKYDNQAIGSFLSRLFKQDSKKFTCVELACELLESVGFKFEYKNLKPDELYEYLSLCNGKAIRCRNNIKKGG
jgi:hypothetical protein